MVVAELEYVEKVLDRIPPATASRDVICNCLRALRTSTWEEARWACSRILEIDTATAWFSALLAGLDHAQSLREGLKSVIAGRSPPESPNIHGRTENVPALATLCLVNSFGESSYLETLRAVYIGALIHPKLGSEEVGSSHLDTLGSAIRSIEMRSRARHRALGEFRKALPSLSPGELAVALFNNVADTERDGDADSAHGLSIWRSDWQRVWRPWLAAANLRVKDELVSVPPEVTAPPPSPPPSPPASPPTAPPATPSGKKSSKKKKPSPGSKLKRNRPTTTRVELPGISRGFGTETSDESSAQVTFSTPQVRRPVEEPESNAEAADRADKRIRQNNPRFTRRHIAYLTDDEDALVDSQLLAISAESTEERFVICRDAVLGLLVRDLGLSPKAIQKISFRIASRGMRIDLSRALIFVPIPVEEGVRKIDPQWAHKFDPMTDGYWRPLRTVVHQRLSALYAARPVDSIRGWFVGADPDAQLTEMLKALDLPQFTRSKGRLRRTLIARMDHAGFDGPLSAIAAGQSDASTKTHLHYYNARPSDVLKLVANVQGPGAIASVPPADPAVRIGAAPILSRTWARKGVSQICNALNRRTSEHELRTPHLARDVHNTFAELLMFWIAFGTNHRPHAALFALSRYAFDTVNASAIIDDKRVGVAYWNRFAPMPRALALSIQHYLRHLLALSEQPWTSAAFRARVSRTVSGTASLLCLITDDQELRDMTPDDWTAAWPMAWAGVADNWYRPYLATHLRESGVDAVSVMASLAHLESTGWIFSSQSPVAPADILERVHPALDRLNQDLGFKVRLGFSAFCPSNPELPQLKDWSSTLVAQERGFRAFRKRLKKILKARLKEHRLTALSWLQTTFIQNFPDLANVIHASRSSSLDVVPTRLRNVVVDDEVIVNVVEHIRTTFAKDEVARIAVHNLFSSTLSHARKRLQLRCAYVDKFVHVPSAEASPFLGDQALATEQCALIRNHLRALAACGKPLNMPAVVRRCIGLTLFGGRSDAEQICRLVTTPKTAIIPAVVDGGLLLRDGELTVGLRDEAALSFLAPSDDLPAQAPTPAELGRALASWFPTHLVGDPDTLLRRLCSTVDVANRFERSGLERQVMAKDGTLDATIEQQNAFFSGSLSPDGSYPTMARVKALDVTDAGDTSSTQVLSHGHTPRQMRQYNALTALLGGTQDQFSQGELPNVGKDGKEQIDKLRALLKDFVKPRGACLFISEALADFALDLADNGTPERSDPRVSTVRTYIGAIGRMLVTTFGHVDLNTLDEDDFEAAYRKILRRVHGRRSAPRTLWQLRHFHSFLVRQFDIEPIPPDALLDDNDDSEEHRVKELITDGETDLAVAFLLGQAADTAGPDSFHRAEWRRACRAAAVALVLLRRSGARIGEVARIRLADIALISTWCVLLIRPSEFQDLKTAAARRLIELTDRLTPEERAILREWIEGERARLSDKDRRRGLLFGKVGNAMRAIGSGRLRRLIQLAFQQTCGRHVWPHLFRHALFSEELPEACEAPGLARHDAPASAIQNVQSVRCMFGHAFLWTGVHYYFHTGWRLLRTPRSVVRACTDRWLLVLLTGQQVATVDKRAQVAKKELTISKDQPEGWTRALIEIEVGRLRHPPPEIVARRPAEFIPIDHPLTPYQLSVLLTLARDRATIDQIAPNLGLSLAGRDLIWNACTDVAHRTHFRLVPLPTRRGNTRPDPMPRDIECPEADGLLRVSKVDEAETLVQAFDACYSPSSARHDQFEGPRSHIESFASRLRAHGAEPRVVATPDEQAILRFETARSVSAFHRVAWTLAVISAWSAAFKWTKA